MPSFWYYIVLASAVASWFLAVGCMISAHRKDKIIEDMQQANRVMWAWVREANGERIDWDFPDGDKVWNPRHANLFRWIEAGSNRDHSRRVAQ